MLSIRNRVGVNERDGGALIFCASRARFGIARLARTTRPRCATLYRRPSANRPSLIASVAGNLGDAESDAVRDVLGRCGRRF
jgi:hypothetical protein